MTSINKEKVAEDLQVIVNQFNHALEEWMLESGCRANFQWRYGLDRNVKSMEVQTIDLIVYRKPAPSFEIMQDTIAQNS